MAWLYLSPSGKWQSVTMERGRISTCTSGSEVGPVPGRWACGSTLVQRESVTETPGGVSSSALGRREPTASHLDRQSSHPVPFPKGSKDSYPHDPWAEVRLAEVDLPKATQRLFLLILLLHPYVPCTEYTPVHTSQYLFLVYLISVFRPPDFPALLNLLGTWGSHHPFGAPAASCPALS